MLAISDRQVNRLLVRYREAGVCEYAEELIRQSYRDFGPTLATEVLQERHGIIVGRERSASGWQRQACDCRVSSARPSSALAELNIEILCANSSQAKGRVERANRTLRDRLVKELRLAGASDIEAGNLFLPAFVESFIQRFSVRAVTSQDLPRKLNVAPSRLNDILSHSEQHYFRAQLTISSDRKQIMLERNDVTEELAGKYVELHDFFDRPLEVHWEGVALPYPVFSKDQRVSHTAVVENKRLSHALTIVKAQQDLKRETKVRAKSEKTGWRKNPRAVYGPNFVEKRVRAPRWK